MFRNIIELENGTRVTSGAGVKYAIQSCTITESVNSGTELTLGSACCSSLEATILDPEGDLSLTAGDQITLYKVDDAGVKTKVGVFLLEAPTRKSDNVYKITAYDLMTKLDRDMSQWLKEEFTNWGCTLAEFACEVCDACGLQMKITDFPNSTFPVPKFYKSGVTGRQLMQWIAEIAGRFCRVDADGFVELAWYTDSGVTVQPTGDRYYFAGALTYEDYEVAAIDAVQLRLADSDNGALWPSDAANNPYIITGNPILMAQITEDLEPYLKVIQNQLAALPRYKPCKISLPAGLDLRAGHTVQIVDKKGNQLTTCVMTKTQTGQRDTLECTGSARRDSTTAANNKSASQLAQQAVENQTHEDVFNKLTKNGAIQGIYVQDGKWYINAEQVVLQNLKVKAADITGVITVKDANGNTLFSAGDKAVTIAGWNADNNSIRYGSLGGAGSMWLCRTGTTSSPSSYGQSGIAGTDATKTGWCITVGNNFGVDKSGALFATGAKITGTIEAKGGTIGGWTIGDGKLTTEVDGLPIGFSPFGVTGYYEAADGTDRYIEVSWKAILTAAVRWNE